MSSGGDWYVAYTHDTCDWCEGLPAAEHEHEIPVGLLISQCSQCSMTRSN